MIFIYFQREVEYVVIFLIDGAKESFWCYEVTQYRSEVDKAQTRIRLAHQCTDLQNRRSDKAQPCGNLLSISCMQPAPQFPRTNCLVSPQVPEVPLGQPVNNQLLAYRIRLDPPVPEPRHQSAKEPGSERCHHDWLSAWAPPSSAGESRSHHAGTGLRCVWDHGLPAGGLPACPEPLLPAEVLQPVWEPPVHGGCGEAAATHRCAALFKARALSCPSGDLQTLGCSPGSETCPASGSAVGDSEGLGTSQDHLD